MLESVKGPDDLRGLTPGQLNELSEEIRQFLITKVSKTGGHLGPNLGVVELTIALHRIFDSPKDVILFDTGHQSYVHKIITGRADQFDGLRQRGGIAGYPNRRESEHDVIACRPLSRAQSKSETCRVLRFPQGSGTFLPDLPDIAFLLGQHPEAQGSSDEPASIGWLDTTFEGSLALQKAPQRP